MNYKKQYELLISTRKLLDRKKKKGIYYEKHHIIPKACGGTNEECNLILLTAKEHYIAHLLLTKMYSGHIKSKMVYALWRFSNSKSHSLKPILSASQYENARKLFIEEQHNRIISSKRKESYKLFGELRKGKKRNPEIGKKISLAKKGNSGKKLKGRSYEDIYGKERSDELKKVRHDKHSKETIEKIKMKLNKKIIVNNILYESITECANILNISISLLRYRLMNKTEKFKNYNYGTK